MTPEILSQLGTLPDSEFALLAGISRQAATGLRKAAGRPAVALSAAQLAERRRERLDRARPEGSPRAGRSPTYGAIAALTDDQLRMSTAAVVALTNVTAGGVEYARRKRGILEWEGKGDRTRKVRRAPVAEKAPLGRERVKGGGEGAPKAVEPVRPPAPPVEAPPSMADDFAERVRNIAKRGGDVAKATRILNAPVEAVIAVWPARGPQRSGAPHP